VLALAVAVRACCERGLLERCLHAIERGELTAAFLLAAA
jgi:hypothetical protein